jgi:hypothetical protein
MINLRRVAGAAGGVLAAIVLLTGCAQPGTQSGAGAAPAGQDVLADIITQIDGTPEQREAGHQRQFYAWQAALGTCMTGKGADFGLPTYVTGGLGAPINGPGDMLAWSPRYDDFGIATRTATSAKIPGPRDNPARLELTGDAAAAWVKTQFECEPATKPTEDLHLPENMLAVSIPFQDELAKIQDELAPGLVNAYATCMTGKGVPATDLPGVIQLAGQKYPPTPNDKASDPTRASGWAEAVAHEKQLAGLDWQCRGAEATRVVDASSARLTAWAEQHHTELAAVAAAWAAMPAARDEAKTAAQRIATK